MTDAHGTIFFSGLDDILYISMSETLADKAGPDEDIEISGKNDDGPVHMQIVIKRRRSHSRLDKYLQGRFPRFSRTAMQRLIKQGAVTLNGGPIKASHEVTAGDVIDLILPPPEVNEILPEDIPLEIIYEDDYLLAVNKPAGMIVHPARGQGSGTLVNALVYYCQGLSSGDDQCRPGIVHRLDRDTTGVILVAKTDEAHWRLSLQFERRRIEKQYLAVVEGLLELDSDRIDGAIGSDPHFYDRYCVDPQQGRAAMTTYEVIERLGKFTYVRLLPLSGRTHQLRVHMSYIGHPVVADTMYGARKITVGQLSGDENTDFIMARQALHAHKIGFKHPITGRQVSLEAPLGQDFEDLLQLLNRYK